LNLSEDNLKSKFRTVYFWES